MMEPTTKKLSKVQTGFLRGIQQKHQMAANIELGAAIQDVMDELGLREAAEAGEIFVNFSPDFSTVTYGATTGTPGPAVPPLDEPEPTPEEEDAAGAAKATEEPPDTDAMLEAIKTETPSAQRE